MTPEEKLVERLRLIEALFAGAATQGERIAAEKARERIKQRLRSVPERPVEYRFTLTDMWARKLFVALLRRYDIKPYRYKRQRYTTVMARVPHSFVDSTLWPEFERLSETLQQYLDEVTDRVISQCISSDQSEAEVVEVASLRS